MFSWKLFPLHWLFFGVAAIAVADGDGGTILNKILLESRLLLHETLQTALDFEVVVPHRLKFFHFQASNYPLHAE